MPFKDKSKPGILGKLFTKKGAQPSTVASSGTKDVVTEDDGTVTAAPSAGDGAGNGLFSARRGARRQEPFIDVEDVEVLDIPAVPKAATEEASVSEVVAAEESATVTEAPVLDKKPAKESLLKSLFKPTAKSDKPAKASKPEKPAKAKKEKTSKKGLAAAAAIHAAGASGVTFFTELENGKLLYWTVTKSKLTQIEAISPKSKVFSFSREDIRLRTDNPLNFTKAQEIAIQDIGEMVAVVNRSKDLGAVFATREDRATTSPYRFAPAQQALDIILKKKNRQGASIVTGFLLKDSETGSSVVILYHVSAEGDSSRPQITVNPDNLDFVLSQFTASRKLNRKETEVVLFNNEEFLSVAGNVQYFANEKVWKGVPVRVLQNAGAVATGICAAGAIGWAGYGHLQHQILTGQLKSAESSLRSLTEKSNALISTSMVSFANNVSLDEKAMFKTAEQLWLPSAQVTAELTAARTSFSVVMPLSNNKTFSNRPSTGSVTPNIAVEQFYAKDAPEGCVKENLATSGSLHEIRINVVCQSSDTAFSRYRID